MNLLFLLRGGIEGLDFSGRLRHFLLSVSGRDPGRALKRRSSLMVEREWRVF